jgi:hypothetical protein
MQWTTMRLKLALIVPIWRNRAAKQSKGSVHTMAKFSAI